MYSASQNEVIELGLDEVVRVEYYTVYSVHKSMSRVQYTEFFNRIFSSCMYSTVPVEWYNKVVLQSF